MKNRILAVLGLILLVAVPAFAQNPNPTRFKVPFSFQIGERAFPAGVYSVEYNHQSKSVLLRSYNAGGAFAMVATNAYRPNQVNLNVLQFQQFGKIWVLNQVRIDGYEEEVIISKSRQEELARLNAPAQPTLVASIAADR
jgi:hypothetical protein